VELPYIPFLLKQIMLVKKGSKEIYNIMVGKYFKTKSKDKWNSIFTFSNNKWKEIYTIPFKVTKSSSLQWFQYKINHRILATNEYLFKIGLKNSNKCYFCLTSVEKL